MTCGGMFTVRFPASVFGSFSNRTGAWSSSTQFLCTRTVPSSRLTSVTRKARTALAPGSRLVREWQGRPHTIEVLEDGFLYVGRRYRSLSEIARAITGARWSGPRFFGL